MYVALAFSQLKKGKSAAKMRATNSENLKFLALLGSPSHCLQISSFIQASVCSFSFMECVVSFIYLLSKVAIATFCNFKSRLLLLLDILTHVQKGVMQVFV